MVLLKKCKLRQTGWCLQETKKVGCSEICVSRWHEPNDGHMRQIASHSKRTPKGIT